MKFLQKRTQFIRRMRARIFLRRGLSLVALLLITHKADAVGTYLLDESFNSMTTNAAPVNSWISAAPNGSVQVRELPFAADKSVRIEEAAGPGQASPSPPLPNYRGRGGLVAEGPHRGGGRVPF